MTNEFAPATPPDDSSSSISDTASTAKEQASNVGHDAAESAKNVAGTAKTEASKVVGESKKQAKALYSEARDQLTEQAGVQQERVAAGLRNIGDELSRMAESSDQQGIAGDLVSQAASRSTAAASWLDGRDPGALLTEVKNYARRKPGTFIAISAVAGLVAGRLVKSLAADAKDEKDAASSSPSTSASSASTVPATPVAPPAAPTADIPIVAPATAAATEPNYASDSPLFDEVRPAYNANTTEGRQL